MAFASSSSMRPMWCDITWCSASSAPTRTSRRATTASSLCSWKGIRCARPVLWSQWRPKNRPQQCSSRNSLQWKGGHCALPFSFAVRARPELGPVILERRKTSDLSRLALARFANRAQRAAGDAGEVTILLTTDAEMQRLNQQFRGKNQPTDVLSFPHAAPPDHQCGDIAVSLQTARAHAAQQGHSLLTEI